MLRKQATGKQKKFSLFQFLKGRSSLYQLDKKLDWFSQRPTFSLSEKIKCKLVVGLAPGWQRVCQLVIINYSIHLPVTSPSLPRQHSLRKIQTMCHNRKERFHAMCHLCHSRRERFQPCAIAEMKDSIPCVICAIEEEKSRPSFLCRPEGNS